MIHLNIKLIESAKTCKTSPSFLKLNYTYKCSVLLTLMNIYYFFLNCAR